MKRLLFFLLFLPFGITAQYAEPCKTVPELNQAIVDVLKPYIGKKIGRGECWDAAELALNAVGAEWDGLYEFGKAIDVKTECIQPGDIIQFEKVKVEVRSENGGFSETFFHHTAIVYKVLGPGKVELMHQNTGSSGRKMGLSELNLANVVKGEITIYRPQKKT